MNKTARFFLLGAGLAAGLGGCRQDTPAPAMPAAPAPVSPAAAPSVAVAPAAPADRSSIKDVLNGITTSGQTPFPGGTRVLSVDVTDGVATVDFNKAFNGLSNLGDSSESQTQKVLRAALARYPEIQKMRVTVEGKPFDSQNTDWTTPFPVRDGVPPTAADGSSPRP